MVHLILSCSWCNRYAKKKYIRTSFYCWCVNLIREALLRGYGASRCQGWLVAWIEDANRVVLVTLYFEFRGEQVLENMRRLMCKDGGGVFSAFVEGKLSSLSSSLSSDVWCFLVRMRGNVLTKLYVTERERDWHMSIRMSEFVASEITRQTELLRCRRGERTSLGFEKLHCTLWYDNARTMSGLGRFLYALGRGLQSIASEFHAWQNSLLFWMSKGKRPFWKVIWCEMHELSLLYILCWLFYRAWGYWMCIYVYLRPHLWGRTFETHQRYVCWLCEGSHGKTGGPSDMPDWLHTMLRCLI